MHTYQGSCHCGAIRFTFSGPQIEKGVRCNCSICRRKGATMSDFLVASEELHIEMQGDALATYTFASHVAKHHFCKVCGIYPFHQTLRKPGHYRINLGCVHDLDSTTLPCDILNGAAL